MKQFEQLTYTKKIKWRIRFLWLTIAVMLVYMVVVGEIGGGDSRIMTSFANDVSRTIFFGGLVYVIYRLYKNKTLLKDRIGLKKQMQIEQDERNQYIHDKSGGLVVDLLLLFLLFTTLTASLFNMAAFYTSVTILAVTIALKAAAFFTYSRR